jgi:hypothetical protein
MVPPARCFALDEAALRRELPKIPPALRAPTMRLQAKLIASDRRLISTAPRNTVCVGTWSRHSSGQECGISAAAIRHGVPPTDSQGVFSGVVPDGVASVTLRYRTAEGHAVSATGTVIGNMYAIRGRQDFGPSPLLTIVWRSAQGTVLKTVKQPSPSMIVHYCKRHPGSCAPLQVGIVQSSGSSSSTTASLTPRAGHKRGPG